jgi:hypothetical protein
VLTTLPLTKVKTALLAAGQRVGGVAAQVFALTKRGLATVSLTKWKTAALVLLIAGLVPAGVLVTHRILDPIQAPATSAPATSAPAALVIGIHDYSQWQLYAPPEAGFKVYFPKEQEAGFKLSELHVKEPFQRDGDTIHQVEVGPLRRGAGWSGCDCEWLIRDKPFATKEEERAYLKGYQQERLKNAAVKFKTVEEKEFTMNDYQGREFIIEAVQDRYAEHCRVYVAGNLVVRLHVNGGYYADQLSPGVALKFLDSLSFDP